METVDLKHELPSDPAERAYWQQSLARWRRELAHWLEWIETNDADYYLRERALLRVHQRALWLGFPVGYRIDPQEPDWPVFFVELPTGQVSWHMQAFPREWDGHDSVEKYRRCQAFAASVKEQNGHP